uniref:Uncharacterized protein n=1 Tax=viral metagenome TaxID=1070528 RepID=A0A6C0KL81_9ZZZZ
MIMCNVFVCACGIINIYFVCSRCGIFKVATDGMNMFDMHESSGWIVGFHGAFKIIKGCCHRIVHTIDGLTVNIREIWFEL